MNFPKELKYTEEHEWIRIESDDIAYVGITDFAQGELGDIVYVEIDTLGDTLDQNEIFGTIEAVKTTSDLYMPVSGEVLEFNSKLDAEEEDEPAHVNSDPYGDGWIIKLRLTKPEELEDLMDAETYEASVQ